MAGSEETARPPLSVESNELLLVRWSPLREYRVSLTTKAGYRSTRWPRLNTGYPLQADSTHSYHYGQYLGCGAVCTLQRGHLIRFFVVVIFGGGGGLIPALSFSLISGSPWPALDCGLFCRVDQSHGHLLSQVVFIMKRKALVPTVGSVCTWFYVCVTTFCHLFVVAVSSQD